MFCKNCGEKIKIGNNFCNKCGTPVEKEKLEKSIVDIEYFSIPPIRLAVLSALTLGLYEIYWFAKNWEAIRRAEQRKISPVGRAIFTVFYCYDFFKKVLQSAKKHGYNDAFSPGLSATVYIILLLAGNGLGRIENTTFELDILYLLIAIFSFIPLLAVQKAINFNNSKIVQNYHENRKFSRGEIILTIIGVILFGLVILGTFSSLIPDGKNEFSTNSPASSTNLIPDTQVKTTSSDNSQYDQEEIVSSVVNILCPSADPKTESSGGSGTIFTEDGLILTNSHIIPQDKEKLFTGEEGCLVVLPDPTTGQPKDFYLAKPIVLPGVSDKYDLAFMSIYDAYRDVGEGEIASIYPRKFPSFDDTSRCKNEKVQLGEPVRIYGYPVISGGYFLTITDGVVSSFSNEGLIYTSAKISSGNSGGLAIDKYGCMIGVPSMVSTDENSSLGIIISMSMVEEFSSEAKAYIDLSQ